MKHVDVGYLMIKLQDIHISSVKKDVSVLKYLNDEKNSQNDFTEIVAVSPKGFDLSQNFYEVKTQIPTVWTQSHVYMPADQQDGYEVYGWFLAAPRNPPEQGCGGV